MNIKIIAWPEGSNLASASARGQRYFKIDIFTLSSHLRSLLTHMKTFYLEVKCFTKNGDKFCWVKYWQMTFNSPNLPKFSPATILRNKVYTHD